MHFPVPYVAIVDVGHGNSTIMRSESETIIIDCGSRGSGLLEFLNRENIHSIDSVFLSHADHDHIGGLLALLTCLEINIHSVYINSDSSKDSKLWDDLTYELSQRSEKSEIKFRIGITRDLGTIKWSSLGFR